MKFTIAKFDICLIHNLHDNKWYTCNMRTQIQRDERYCLTNISSSLALSLALSGARTQPFHPFICVRKQTTIDKLFCLLVPQQI